MKNIIIYLLVSLVLFSCEKTIQIDIPDNGRKLVVNSFFGADSVLMVSLTESRYILDNKYNFDKIADAEIRLYEGDKYIESLQMQEDSTYFGNYILKANNIYKIEVNSGEFPQLTAESLLPEKTEILELSAENTKDEEGYDALGFTLTFKDNPEEDNYYFVEVYQRYVDHYTDYETGNDTVYVYYDQIYLYSFDPNTLDEWGLGEGLLLNDELFNGEKYSLKFFGYGGYYAYEYDEYGNPVENTESDVSFYVYLKSVSKEFYLYYKSLAKHFEAQDEFFMEPVQVYNNIENGFGVFAGYSEDLDSTRIQN